jgi:hypothetical protein
MSADPTPTADRAHLSYESLAAKASRGDPVRSSGMSIRTDVRKTLLVTNDWNGRKTLQKNSALPSRRIRAFFNLG